jgi:hypothetical protein
MAHIKPCTCALPSPNALGVFCKSCGGFIEENNRCRSLPRDVILRKFKHFGEMEGYQYFESCVDKLTTGENVYDVLDDLLLYLKKYYDI